VSAGAGLVPASIGGQARPLGRFSVAAGSRAFILLIVGLAWLVPAFVDTRFAYAMVAWDGLVAVAWYLDLQRLPRPGQIGVRRSWLAPVALSVESHVQVTLVNGSARAMQAHVLDAVPSALRLEPPQLRLDVAAGGEADGQYAIRPAARGNTSVGQLYLRYQSPLGLAERWATVPLAQTIVAYPNLAEAKQHSIYLIRSRQIELERRSTRRRGTGRAFESLREYREGDEFRDLCWTASARRGKLVTRLYEIERSQTIWVLLDSGRLMRARVGGLSKLDYAVNAALALSQVALNSGDRIGVLAYGRTVAQRVPAARGRAHLSHLVDELAHVREDEWEADHLLAAGRLLTDQKSRSLVVWITDLAETAMTPDVVRAAAQLMSRHVVLFVVIGQPDLSALAERDPRTVEEMYQTAAAQEVAHRRELLLATLRARGALALETSSAGLSAAVVNGYLDVKQRNRL
jgi:uncharacterized protein (DUF58 family)